VDESFRGMLFAPTGKTRDLTLSLASDLQRFGGKIKLIGPTPEGNGDASWCIMPECPEALAPLFQIIPVQAAALRLAQLRGIAPGSFRYAPQVATNEACFNQP
jgi:glucosamine--fructose-6-phosphate aminotransferase (isomerizing)